MPFIMIFSLFLIWNLRSRPDLCGGRATEARAEDSSPASEQFIGQIDSKALAWT